MRHDYQDRVSLEMARRVALLLPLRPELIALAKDNIERWRLLNANAPGLLRAYAEWSAHLDRPVPEIVAILTDDTDEGQRLRQSSPFAGALPPREVWDIKRRFRYDQDAD